jgi:hypothetical protein
MLHRKRTHEVHKGCVRTVYSSLFGVYRSAHASKISGRPSSGSQSSFRSSRCGTRMQAKRDWNAPRGAGLRHTQNDIPETARTPTEKRIMIAGAMLPFDEGCETPARGIIASALLRVGDMVGVVRVEGGESGNYPPF